MHRLLTLLIVLATLLLQGAALGASPVFVLNSLEASVSVIDPLTWREIKRLPTGKEPHHLYLTPDEKSLIIANALSDSLLFVDPKTAAVQRTVTGILDPYQLRFSPDMKWFVTVANRLNHVDIYRWDGVNLQLAKRIATGKTPSHVWIDSASRTAYASMQDSNELVAIDLPSQTLKWRSPTGAMPADVFGTPDDKFLLLGLTGGQGVEVYDVTGVAPKLVKLLRTGEGAHAFRGAGDKRHVFVSNRVANTISKIDYQTMTVVENYPAPSGPDCMDVSADGRLIYVASRWAKKLTVIDTQTPPWCDRWRWVSRPTVSGRSIMHLGSSFLKPKSAICLIAFIALSKGVSANNDCKKPIYLTLDTGHMGVANLVAEVLQRQAVKVTFFAANERTQVGDGSLGQHWSSWWRARALEGHEFASHTFDHVVWRTDLPGMSPTFKVRPTAGALAGHELTWSADAYCSQLKLASTRLQEVTGIKPLPLFRAPGGKTSAKLLDAARSCGFAHVAWAAAGFLGDELPSERFSNAALLAQALRGIRTNDILVAHLGIWSRQSPWAPAVLEPLIVGLKDRGFCFATLREHPDYRGWIMRAEALAARVPPGP